MRLCGVFAVSAILALGQTPPMIQRPPLAPCTLTGRVTTTSGDPLVGAKVTVGRTGDLQYSALSDATGAYSVQDVYPGSHQVWAEHSGNAIVQHNAVSLAPGQSVSNVNFKLPIASLVSGKLIDEQGQAVSGATVSILYQDSKARISPVYDPIFPQELESRTYRYWAWQVFPADRPELEPPVSAANDVDDTDGSAELGTCHPAEVLPRSR